MGGRPRPGSRDPAGPAAAAAAVPAHKLKSDTELTEPAIIQVAWQRAGAAPARPDSAQRIRRLPVLRPSSLRLPESEPGRHGQCRRGSAGSSWADDHDHGPPAVTPGPAVTPAESNTVIRRRSLRKLEHCDKPEQPTGHSSRCAHAQVSGFHNHGSKWNWAPLPD